MSEYDPGPLSWVQGEIDQSITRTLECLAAFRTATGDAAALKHARSHLHQAAGAVQMVGLDAVVAFADEIERQLSGLDGLSGPAVQDSVDVVDRACRKLQIFLDEVANGSAPVALKLFPEYEAMQHVRGVKAVAPTDLFYPDLSPRLPAPDGPAEEIAATHLASFLIKQRRLYQRGMLTWLRGDAEGAIAMRDAIAGIEAVTVQPKLRSFWRTVAACFDALGAHGLDASFGVKQLAARIDLQVRRLVEGSAKVADRLRREVLYFVAISAPVTPMVEEVQRVFNLAPLIPSADALNADLVRLRPHLREAQEQLAAAKDVWIKFTSGRAENLPKLKQVLAGVHRHGVETGSAALMRLTAALVDRLDRFPLGNVPEPVAMEYATAMLLAESAFANFTSVSPEFPQQVDAMLSRLDAAQASRPYEGPAEAPLLDEMAKRAQERVLLAQVGREIQANLRHMEQVLDAFFRDNAKRADLSTLTKDSRQIRGALRMLDLDSAEQLLGLCQAQIESYADPETPVSNDDLELLAEALSGLGFYVEAVEQQRPDRDRLIAPLLQKRLGETAAVVAEEQGESVEAAVDELRSALPELIAEMHRAPADHSARETLQGKLADLQNDAELIGDADLAAQAGAALKELDAGGTATLAEAVTAIAEGGAAAPAPEISEETQRLLATEQLDAELVEIFLAEADEVLDSIALHHRILTQNPGDREALRTVRRGFHTLKGSGRMVGLTGLGEIAYDVEKIHNRLLEEERPVTGAVLVMIGTAERDFRQWVGALATEGRVLPDADDLHEAIRAVEFELPGNRESVLIPPAPIAVPVVPVPPAPVAPQIEIIELAEVEDESELSVVEFAVADGSMAPAIDVAPVAAADATSEDVDAEVKVASGPEPVVTADVEAEAEETTVGDVTLSTALYRILVDEADAHLATLAHELSLMQFDPERTPSATMARASHTLCGIHRTAGFPLIATTAQSLEQCLLGLQQRDPAHAESTLPTLLRAVSGLATLVGRVKSGAGFDAADAVEAEAIRNELEALRRAQGVPQQAFDAETWAAREAESEELEGSADVHAIELAEPAAPPTFEVIEEGEAVAELAAPTGESMVGDAALPAAPIEVADEVVAPVADGTVTEVIAVEIPAEPVADEVSPEPVAESVPVEVPVDVPRTAVVVQLPTQTAISVTPPIVHAAPAVAADSLTDVRDDVDEQLLPIFLEEAAELFPQAGEQLRAWRRNPLLTDSPHRLRRTLHTFKGSARMAGAMRLGELTHLMESRLLDGDEPAAATPELFEALDTDLDRVAFVLEALREGRTNVALPWIAEHGIESVSEPAADAAVEAAVPETRSEGLATAEATPDVVTPQVVPPAPITQRPAVVAPAAVAELEAGQRAMLRVRADVIDRLVNEAGEVAITRARVEGELRSLKSNLLELTASVIRLRTQVREIEIQAESQIQSRLSQVGEVEGFDPLEFDRYTRFQELARSLAEGINDVSTVQQALLKNLDDADVALVAQARLSRDVQQQLFAIRTVPFGSLSERLYRILRQLAKDLDKRANLDIRGGQTELDRSVLEKLVGPLEHMLRNALDHGIEPREARARAGKPDTGEIALTVRQVGNEIAIELADDGAGLDLANIRRKAIGQGRIAADAELTDAQLVDLIFQAGFSTASKVTQVSGRGIGMDVVRAEINALGGRVEVTTKPGSGTRFLVYLPLTLAVAQAALVRAGGRLWALPAPMIEQVQQVNAEALLGLYLAGKVEWQGQSYPFHYLPRLLGDAAVSPETARHNAVLLLRTGQGLAAVHVDEMVGNQEVVVKNIGPQLARVSGIAGATVLGSGEIVLIINPVQLAQRADVARFDPNAEERVAVAHSPVAPSGARSVTPLVMVVDDSLTVRKVTSRLLTREGFAVTTAKDGVEALELLQDQVPDVILLDIEMPRMDGFEFTKAIKSDPKTANIPIVMITSRTAEKHRNLARELGVDLYLGKPFQEDELLRNLREMLALTV